MGSVCLKPGPRQLPDGPAPSKSEANGPKVEEASSKAAPVTTTRGDEPSQDNSTGPSGAGTPQQSDSPVVAKAAVKQTQQPQLPAGAAATGTNLQPQTTPDPQSQTTPEPSPSGVSHATGVSSDPPSPQASKSEPPGSTSGPPKQLLGYDSEGALSNPNSMDRASVFTAPVHGSASLDKETSYKLRKYAKRNRPDKSRFMTQPAMPRERSNSPPTGDIPAVPEAGEKPAIPERADDRTPSTELPPSQVKYDIFDDVDAERLKEFDDMFEKVKQTSNYQAHKKKTKSLNKNKFSTAAAVTTDEDTGQTSIT